MVPIVEAIRGINKEPSFDVSISRIMVHYVLTMEHSGLIVIERVVAHGHIQSIAPRSFVSRAVRWMLVFPRLGTLSRVIEDLVIAERKGFMLARGDVSARIDVLERDPSIIEDLAVTLGMRSRLRAIRVSRIVTRSVGRLLYVEHEANVT